MPITPKQQDSINFIMDLTYYQYSCPWCKVQSIDEMKDLLYNKQSPQVDAYLSNPPSLKLKQKVLGIFLEDILTNYTPESFMYYEMLESKWTSTKHKEHEQVIEKMMLRVEKSREKYQKQKNEELVEYLKNWGVESIESYENASIELKDEIDLTAYSKMIGYGQEVDVFSDYRHLQMVFLHDLFDADSVDFFVNVLPENINAFWEEGKMPAVIGIDSQVIGLFWWND